MCINKHSRTRPTQELGVLLPSLEAGRQACRVQALRGADLIPGTRSHACTIGVLISLFEYSSNSLRLYVSDIQTCQILPTHSPCIQVLRPDGDRHRLLLGMAEHGLPLCVRASVFVFVRAQRLAHTFLPGYRVHSCVRVNYW